MKLLKDFTTEQKNDCLFVDFGKNCNVTDISMNCASTVKVMYVRNSVIDSPFLLGKTSLSENGRQRLTPERDIPSSHLYLYSSGREITDIEITEREEVDLENIYPKCFDIPLPHTYNLDTVTVFTKSEGFSHYSLYTSQNGRDFDLVCIKDNDKPCGQNGDTYSLYGKTAKVIRVYDEYNSASPECSFSDLKYTGKQSETAETAPKPEIADFKGSEYDVKPTDKDATDEVYGIVKRRIGEAYTDWFNFKIFEKKEYDYFGIEYKNGKIEITGNTGVCIAAGLNYYLKYFCGVSISQVGDNVKMPQSIVVPKKRILRETKAKIRYAYNYCTLSYSNAFWGEKEWRNELDWLALNGVNLVLDINGQEEVWRRFLGKLGYNDGEIKSFLTGPAFYAWQYMANMFGFGGPVPDSWFADRTSLARKNQLIMRKLGMKPVLQGYSGMVPIDIKKHDKCAEIIPQGKWCGLQRPSMLKTNSKTFNRYAGLFYTSQKEVLGEAQYFATDPFHEGGITGGMSPRVISKCVLNSMLEANKDAVWIIQSWQSNPTSELLLGIKDVDRNKKHALVLDLYAEKTPNYPDGGKDNKNHGYSPEFDGTPWVYCMLNNFGGRLGLHGHLDNMVRDIPKIMNECKYFEGIGMTCEASENNPVLYDFLFESVWQENAGQKAQNTHIKTWLHNYSARRYGGESESAFKAWDILEDTVYKAELNMIGQGAPECIVCARPEYNLKKSSMWGNSLIGYDANELEKSAKLLFADYDRFNKSPAYIYDIISVFEQVLSNRALNVYNKMSDAYNRKNISDFIRYSDKFLSIIEQMESLTANNKYYSFTRFMDFVKELCKNADDFTKRLFRINAKVLVTVSGPYPMCEIGKEHDYANKQWSGLFGSFYKVRWKKFIGETLKELQGKSFDGDINWFEFEWSFVRSDKDYKESAPMSYSELKSLLTDILGEQEL